MALDPSTESVLRAVLRDAQDPMGISHRNRILLANRALVRLFGYDDEQALIGRSFLELMAPEGRATLLAFVERRSRGEEVPGLYTVDALRRDGEPFQVEIRTTTFVLGGEAFALALLRDPAASRGVRELYEAIFARNTAIKLLVEPADGRIVDANDAAATFYGWSKDELRRMRIHDINTLTPDELAVELANARSGRRGYFRFRHRLADGRVRHVDVHSGPVEVEGRSLLLSIVQDTTEREQVEQQLRQAHRLEAVGRLAGGLAHDFNNLLGVVTATGDLLRRELAEPSVARAHLDELLGAVDRAQDLTRQLLAVGQRQELRPERLDPSEVVRTVERLLRRAAGPGVDLRLELGGGGTVEVDRRSMEQVLVNLVLNARDAGARRVVIATGGSEGRATLSVADDGRGMDEATQARIFEPFFSGSGQGTGLGLASVWGIVTQSGGAITVDSRPGRGARFTIALPAVSARTDPPPVGLSVLLVDDEPSLRAVLSEALTAAGFTVSTLASGDAALGLTDDELAQIDVLVTDHAMPGRHSGSAVARTLAARRPGLGVVLVSGDAFSAERAGLPPGAEFVAKPFSSARLVGAILRAVRPPP